MYCTYMCPTVGDRISKSCSRFVQYDGTVRLSTVEVDTVTHFPSIQVGI